MTATCAAVFECAVCDMCYLVTGNGRYKIGDTNEEDNDDKGSIVGAPLCTFVLDVKK